MDSGGEPIVSNIVSLKVNFPSLSAIPSSANAGVKVTAVGSECIPGSHITIKFNGVTRARAQSEMDSNPWSQ